MDVHMRFTLKQRDPNGLKHNRDSIAKFSVGVFYANKTHHIAVLKLSEIRSLVGVPSSAWDKLVAETKKTSDWDTVEATVLSTKFKTWAKAFKHGYGKIMFGY